MTRLSRMTKPPAGVAAAAGWLLDRIARRATRPNPPRRLVRHHHATARVRHLPRHPPSWHRPPRRRRQPRGRRRPRPPTSVRPPRCHRHRHLRRRRRPNARRPRPPLCSTPSNTTISTRPWTGSRHLSAATSPTSPPPRSSERSTESVAENTIDAVTAPLFWATVAGPAGVLTHRAVNTLDAMIGHHDQRYERFGWASARADDLLNWLPARLGALGVAILVPRRARSVVAHRAPRRASPPIPQRRRHRGRVRRRPQHPPRRSEPLRRPLRRPWATRRRTTTRPGRWTRVDSPRAPARHLDRHHRGGGRLRQTFTRQTRCRGIRISAGSPRCSDLDERSTEPLIAVGGPRFVSARWACGAGRPQSAPCAALKG